MPHRLTPVVLAAVLALAACGGDAEPPPEPPAPRAVEAPDDPFAKLPKPRYLDADPPACCPRLLGGWEHPQIAAPGEEVTATLSSPGPDPDNPPTVDVNADVTFRIVRITPSGERIRVVHERRVHVRAVHEIHRPYVETRLPDAAPAHYALEIELRPSRGSDELYVSYAYVPKPEARVALLLDDVTPEPGQTLRLTVANRGAVPLEYGVAYRLERWEGEWKWLNRDAAFIAIAKGVVPGHREHEEIRLPADLAPGRYRIAKSFLAVAARRELDAAVQFTVE